MVTPADVVQTDFLEDVEVGKFGSISVRVVVLPKIKKQGKSKRKKTEDVPLDLEDDEFLPITKSGTAVSSYLESGKGGRQCCVFLVNGQRQDALDNSFIVNELGFKYLRHRMMIIVDVDGLTPEALGKLMQGSRQEFYRGRVFESITKRLVATLKGDPDLDRLEQEAEEEVSELKAGDEQVKHKLDQLIDSHHEHAIRFAEGAGAQGVFGDDDNLGMRTVSRDGVVSLLEPDVGLPAEYPVLVTQPSSTYIRLKPKEKREISLKSMPANAWPALAEITIEGDSNVPELLISQDKLGDQLKLGLRFREGDEFDPNQYPVRANLRATARFNGISEPRRLELRVLVKPDVPPAPPQLEDPPTWVKVSSRQPVKIKRGEVDTHVRLRWNGMDELASGDSDGWSFYARVMNREVEQPVIVFSKPSMGVFTMLITPRPEWQEGTTMRFAVGARHSDGKILAEAAFDAIVVEPQEKPNPTEKEPRKTDDQVMSGSMRRPPYSLRFIGRDKYDSGTCWGGMDWTDEDAACYQDPTDTQPLTLIINEDMDVLREFRDGITRKSVESEVKRRINKYTSHVAYHLFQMYESNKDSIATENDDLDQRNRSEVRRVASTLIKLMEVSR